MAAFIELFLRLRIGNHHRQVQLNIVEKKPKIGQGLAFGTDQPGHLLNTQANLMGIHAREPAHFGDWVRENAQKYGYEKMAQLADEQMYPPRRLYGQYVEDQFQQYLKRAEEEGVPVRVIQEEAIDADLQDNGWRISLDDGKHLYSDYVILAIGTPKRNNYHRFKENAQYVDFPWPSSIIKDRVPAGAEVAILGSSLSAIDTLMTFGDTSHQGKIGLYSRSGLLPRVQPEETAAYERKFITLNNVHKLMRQQLRSVTATELFRLFQKEAEQYEGKTIDWKATGRQATSARKLLENDINVARLGGDAFQNIAYELRYEASVMWSLLSDEEKVRFIRWIGSYWNINRHGMPLVNALRIKSLFDKEQLTVTAGLEEVTFDESRKKFRLTYQGGQHAEADYLINATGTAKRLSDMDITLIQKMHHKKYLIPHSAGGIRINRQHMQVISPHLRHDNLYAVGQLASGELLDTNAVWFNVKTVAKLCQDIIYQLDRGNIS